MGFGRVFLFIFVFALLEVMVLSQVAQAMGWPITILLTVLTALAGSVLFRTQGLETWLRLNTRLQNGEMPGQELVEGVMLLLGGALLITPGFITDGVGFVLLLPLSRAALARFVVSKGLMQSMAVGAGQSKVWVYRQSSQNTDQATQAPPTSEFVQKVYEDERGHLVIDGKAERKDD